MNFSLSREVVEDLMIEGFVKCCSVDGQTMVDGVYIAWIPRHSVNIQQHLIQAEPLTTSDLMARQFFLVLKWALIFSGTLLSEISDLVGQGAETQMSLWNRKTNYKAVPRLTNDHHSTAKVLWSIQAVLLMAGLSWFQLREQILENLAKPFP